VTPESAALAAPAPRLAAGQRRAQLLRLGTEIFSARPFDAVSIDEVARRAGIAKGLLYHYFPSKRDFYVAVIGAAAHELREVTRPETGVAAEDRLRHGLEAYLGFVEHRAQGFRTLMQGGIGSDPEVREIVDSMRALFVGRVAAGMGVEEAPPLLRAALRGWIGMVEAASLDWLENRDLSREALAGLLTLSLGSLVEHATTPRDA